MSPIANGTDAKDIALHFLKAIEQRATPQIIGKTINQAKIILTSGYKKKEILDVIDYIIDKKKTEMYSLGYVGTCINDVLREMHEEVVDEGVTHEIDQLASKINSERSEVIIDHESRERNRERAKRINSECRLRKKFNLDMFEK